MEKWVTTAEAAKEAGVSDGTVRNWEARKNIKSKKDGNQLLVELDSVLEMADSGKGKPPRPSSDPFTVLRALPADHLIQLWRFQEIGGPAFLVEMTPEEFSPGRIMRDFGGGHFLVKALKEGRETNQHTFKVEGPAKHPSNKVGMDPQSDMVRLVRDVVGQVMTQSATPQQVVVAGPPQEDEEERAAKRRAAWLQEMAMMKQIFAPPSAPAPVSGIGLDSIGAILAGLVGFVPKVVEAVQSLQGLGADVPWYERLLGNPALIQAAGPIIEGVSRSLIAPATAPQSVSVGYPIKSALLEAPDPIPVKSSPATPPEPLPPTAPGGMGVSPIQSLAVLVRRAAAENRDPEPFADLILAEIPAAQAAQLKQVSPEQFMEFCKGIDPDLANYPGWIGELREAVIGEEGEGQE